MKTVYRVSTRTGGGHWYTKSVKGNSDAGREQFDVWCGWAKKIARQSKSRVEIRLLRTVKEGRTVVSDTTIRERIYQ